MFKRVLKSRTAIISTYLFGPVIVSGILAALGFKLAGFLVFQLFIEGFVLWHLSIGFTLHGSQKKRFGAFLLFLAIGIIYRFSTNVYQLFLFLETGHFNFMHAPIWVVPIHLIATFGSVYAFYLNATWIVRAESDLGVSSKNNVLRTFLSLLFFPIGIWSAQPRLNAIVSKTGLQK